MPIKFNTLLVSILTGLLITGCAYFNTFYNAEQYFEKAEKSRLEKLGENLPAKAKEAYGNVIERSEKVLRKYPESKYRYRALLLIGKSRFYRQEYRRAGNTFKQLKQENSIDYGTESDYWLALCKWKSGKPQPALDDLERLLNLNPDDRFKAKIFLSTAEIYLDINEGIKALTSLEKAADLTRNRSQRGQIYYRISNIAFEREEYQRALKAYRNVVKYSVSKTRVEEAQLQIVRIFRLSGDYKTASENIKNMLVDDTYSAIQSDLELELVKLYQLEGKTDQAITRLHTITEEYPKTRTSAEAYYLLGEHGIFVVWDPENAKKYFGRVTTEMRSSLFSKSAQRRVKEITAYLETEKALSEKMSELEDIIISDSDTTSVDSIVKPVVDKSVIRNDIAKFYYTISELEAFHFSRTDSSIKHLEIIRGNYTNTELYSKALFTLSYLYGETGDSVKSREYQDRILEDYPLSDYADFIRKKRGLAAEASASSQLLLEAEGLWLINPEQALNNYRAIVRLDSTSESSAQSNYFLAYQFDYEYNLPDSALKYYEMLRLNHPNSDQALKAQDRLTFFRSFFQPTPAEDNPDSIQVDY